MAILSDYFEPKLLDHIFRRNEFTRPSNLYIGISATAFSESDNGITAAAKEPAYDSSVPSYFGDNYSRVLIDTNAQYDATSTNIKNTSGIDFPEAGGSGWGSIQYWAIFDGNTSTANMLMHGSFTSAVTVSAGSQFRIGSGDLEIIFPTIVNDANDSADTTQTGTNFNSLNSRKWRQQLAYIIGFDHPSSVPNDVQNNFTYGASTPSGHYDALLYLAISTTAFPETLSSAELSGTGYARVNISSKFADAATDGSGVTTISNSSAISFPEAGSDWGDIAYWAIFRGDYTTNYGYYAGAYTSGTGNFSSRQALMKGSLTTSKTVNSGDVLRFGIGDFVVTAS